jgi:6-phosphofructokinase 1
MMDTISRVEKYCLKNGYELCAIGIPKTVDNDLFGTDHTPGYASAARTNILSVLQAGLLAHDMQRVDKFVVYQTIGRDAGWLAAATSLARKQECDPPHLVYMPERAFHCDEFLSDAKACVEQYGFLSVVCGEGIKYSDGTPVSSSNVKDKFNNTEFGATASTSVAFNLHAMLRKAYGWRGEFQIPESLIMCAADRAVALDINEAIACGRRAVKLADKGESGQMVAMKRVPGDPYAVEYTTVPLSEVAVHTRPMPSEYVNERGNFVSSKFKRYIEPLVGKLPEYVKLKMKMAMMK